MLKFIGYILILCYLTQFNVLQVLADNLLSRIQLTTDDDGGELLDGGEKGSAIDRSSVNGRDSADDDDDWVHKNSHLSILLIWFHF